MKLSADEGSLVFNDKYDPGITFKPADQSFIATSSSEPNSDICNHAKKPPLGVLKLNFLSMLFWNNSNF